MDTGNPWDAAAAPAASTSEATADPFVDPFVAAEKESAVLQSKPESAWAEFADSEMVPVASDVVKSDLAGTALAHVETGNSSEPAEPSTDAQVPVVEIAASDESAS